MPSAQENVAGRSRDYPPPVRRGEGVSLMESELLSPAPVLTRLTAAGGSVCRCAAIAATPNKMLWGKGFLIRGRARRTSWTKSTRTQTFPYNH